MQNFNNKDEFFSFLQSEIALEAKIENDEKMEEEVFVEKMLDYLVDLNFLENGIVCRHQGHGIKVDAFDLNTPENAIDIIVSNYKSGEDGIQRVGKPDVAKTFKPHHLANYLISVGQKFNEFYHSCPVLSDDINKTKARLLLVDCTRQIISNGLGMMGIESPQEM